MNAITTLRNELNTLANNEPIHRAEGNVELADQELDDISDIIIAIGTLSYSFAPSTFTF